jgi:hypothetical protein
MGYTHFFHNQSELPPLSDVSYGKIQRIVDAYSDMDKIPYIQYDEDDERPAVVSRDRIEFNGGGDDGHERFQWSTQYPSEVDGCKTAGKEYDTVVCLVLLG